MFAAVALLLLAGAVGAAAVRYNRKAAGAFAHAVAAAEEALLGAYRCLEGWSSGLQQRGGNWYAMVRLGEEEVGDVDDIGERELDDEYGGALGRGVDTDGRG